MNFPRRPLSVLSLAPVSSEGTLSSALENLVAVARAIEKRGYTRLWIAEHHNMPGLASAATPVLVGHVAGKTQTLRVGSGGMMLPNHAPIVVAETFGTLATLYPGRIDLGLGRAPGTDPLTARALRRGLQTTGDDFPQLVEELQAYLAPAEPGQSVQAVPGAGADVPLWILGSSLFSAGFAGRMGLPYVFAAHFAPGDLLAAVELYRREFAPSAALAKPYTIVCVSVVAAPSDEEARHLATSPQQKILGLITGRLPRSSPAPVKNMDALWSEREKAAVGRFLAEAIVGGPQRVRTGLASLIERTGADEIMIHTDLHSIADVVRSYEIVADAWDDLARDTR